MRPQAADRRGAVCAEPRLFCDIAEWDGEPAGFAVWFLNFSTFRGRHGIYLEDIFVRPAFRGRGIGKALMAQLGAALRRATAMARFEWAVLDWNAPSIAFYRSIGAQVMDEWKICRLSGDGAGEIRARRPRLMNIVLVAAIGENNVIGRDGQLPWRLKSDLRHFRALTLDQPVIMGRKTFQSIGKPLDRRTNIVVTRDAKFAAPGAIAAPSLKEALELARKTPSGAASTRSW